MTSGSHDDKLAALRDKVENIDTALIGLLAKRVELARDVGAYKREAGLATLDVKREAAVLRRMGTLARDHGLPEEAVRQLFWSIIGICRHAQEEPQ